MTNTSQGTVQTPPPSNKKKGDKTAPKNKGGRKWLLNVAALSTAAIIPAVVTWSLQSHLYSNLFHSENPPPVVSISSVEWPSSGHGLFVAKGTATNVEPGQLLYIFNQPVVKNITGTVYPGSAPCAIKSDHTFNCEDGFAGSPSDTGQDFNISAAIVTAKQADGFGQEEVGIWSRPSSLAMLPHVAGPHAIDSKQVTRTN